MFESFPKTFSEIFIPLSSQRPIFAALDILIVAFIFYYIYRWIKETRAFRIFLGIFVIVLFLLTSKILGLSTLNWLIKNFITMIVVAIPVVFQPELRAALEKLGRVRFRHEIPLKAQEKEKIIEEVVSAVDVLSKTESGALIVFQREDPLKEYIETGTILEADLSTNLLLNIFSKKAPLHDGAVIIEGRKIKAAGCLLPLDDSKRKEVLGARHRAALGISKETDALVVVVSEETGQISLVSQGKMLSLSPFELKQSLSQELK